MGPGIEASALSSAVSEGRAQVAAASSLPLRPGPWMEEPPGSLTLPKAPRAPSPTPPALNLPHLATENQLPPARDCAGPRAGGFGRGLGTGSRLPGAGARRGHRLDCLRELRLEASRPGTPARAHAASAGRAHGDPRHFLFLLLSF